MITFSREDRDRQHRINIQRDNNGQLFSKMNERPQTTDQRR